MKHARCCLHFQNMTNWRLRRIIKKEVFLIIKLDWHNTMAHWQSAAAVNLAVTSTVPKYYEAWFWRTNTCHDMGLFLTSVANYSLPSQLASDFHYLRWLTMAFSCHSLCYSMVMRLQFAYFPLYRHNMFQFTVASLLASHLARHTLVVSFLGIESTYNKRRTNKLVW